MLVRQSGPAGRLRHLTFSTDWGKYLSFDIEVVDFTINILRKCPLKRSWIISTAQHSEKIRVRVTGGRKESVPAEALLRNNISIP